MIFQEISRARVVDYVCRIRKVLGPAELAASRRFVASLRAVAAEQLVLRFHEFFQVSRDFCVRVACLEIIDVHYIDYSFLSFR